MALCCLAQTRFPRWEPRFFFRYETGYTDRYGRDDNLGSKAGKRSNLFYGGDLRAYGGKGS